MKSTLEFFPAHFKRILIASSFPMSLLADIRLQTKDFKVPIALAVSYNLPKWYNYSNPLDLGSSLVIYFVK